MQGKWDLRSFGITMLTGRCGEMQKMSVVLLRFIQLLIKNFDLCKVNNGENSLVLKDHCCFSLPY